MEMDTLDIFSAILTREITSVTSYLPSCTQGDQAPSVLGSTLKGKNSLPLKWSTLEKTTFLEGKQL